MLTRLYQYLGKLIPMDVTKLMVWNVQKSGQSIEYRRYNELGDGYELCALCASQLRANLNNAYYELSASIVESVERGSVDCIGAMFNNQLVGYVFFSPSPVDPVNNSGGGQFNGIGLEFSDRVRYLYKVLVLPEHRGRHLSAHLMCFAGQHFSSHSVEYFVTTTDWTNTAFRKATQMVGFEEVGTAGEVVLLGKHVFFLPPAYAVSHGELAIENDRISQHESTNARGFNTSYIRLVKPDSLSR